MRLNDAVPQRLHIAATLNAKGTLYDALGDSRQGAYPLLLDVRMGGMGGPAACHQHQLRLSSRYRVRTVALHWPTVKY